MTRFIVPLACSTWLAGCNQTPSTDYFPLTKGATWTYEGVIERDGNREAVHLEMHVTGQVMLQDKPVWVRRSGEGARYYIESSATGIARVASRLDSEPHAQLDAAPRYVLKAPYTVGTYWQAPTVPYLLQRKNDFPRELKHVYSTTMNYQIEALDDQVTVPAGTFKPCIRVHGYADLKLYTDPVLGFSTVPLITTEWYCKGVGLAKFERAEKLTSGFLNGGVIRYELRSFKL